MNLDSVEARREEGLSEADELPRRVRQKLERFTIAAAALEGKGRGSNWLGRRRRSRRAHQEQRQVVR